DGILYGGDGCDGGGSRRHGEPFRLAAHGAQADAGGGLRPGKRLERCMTTNPRRIGLIGLGEVGQVLANDLHRAGGVELCAWDRLFTVEGSEPRRAARSLAFVRAASSMAEAVSGSSMVISAVTAGECRAAAGEAAAALTRGALYLDLNSVSPRTKTEAAGRIEAAGGCYVEAAVMSPIAPKGIASPVWLGGPHARAFLPLAQSLGFTGAEVYS